MLTSTMQLMRQAQSNQYAVGAFNVYNFEGVQAVVQAAEAEQSPVLLQIHPKALQYGGKPLIDLCLSTGTESSVPVAVHLDHSTNEADIQLALAANLQSIMADGSDLDYQANIDFTRRMSQQAHQNNVAIEAELGKISGTEDGLTVADYEARMTNPTQAAEFVEQTNVDLLAVCIGNVHGKYPSEPQLDFKRLEAIRNSTDVPLVMHGASGLSEKDIKQSIELGICKFNVNTEVRQAYVQALRDAPRDRDLLDMMQTAVAAMTSVVRKKIQLFSSSHTTQHHMIMNPHGESHV